MIVVVQMPGGTYPVARTRGELERLKARGARHVIYAGPESGWSERFR